MFCYAVMEKTTFQGGQPYPCPRLPMMRVGDAANVGQYNLAASTASAAIKGPCEIHIYTDIDVRLDCVKIERVADLAPSGSCFVLPGGRSVYQLDAGEWAISWSALS